MSEKKRLPNGKRVSNPTGPSSKNKTPLSEDALRKLLGEVYGEFQSMDEQAHDDACSHDFVFHMLDWRHDLERLASLYKHPEDYDRKAAAEIVSGFLYHALFHVRAAARLLLDWEPEDIFKKIDGTPLRARGPSRNTTTTQAGK